MCHLQALAQSFVPDNKSHAPSKQTTETVQVILDKLLALISPEEDEGIGWVANEDEHSTSLVAMPQQLRTVGSSRPATDACTARRAICIVHASASQSRADLPFFIEL